MRGEVELFEIGGEKIPSGETRDITLTVTQNYSGVPIGLPIRVIRGVRPGPALVITGAVHGDELNGTGIVREIILNSPFHLVAGTLVLVPVVNILGFERQSRYLPDRRDLNRCFPGLSEGSLSSRFAHTIFREVVSCCDFGIDIHTAAVRRTNFPNVRGDLEDPRILRLARAFGTELVVNGKGPEGSLRYAACRAGKATILLEAGEVWKVEPSVVEVGIRGVRNVLIELGMVEGSPRRPLYQVRIDRTKWVRADAGGMLRFHLTPGSPVEAGQPIATCSTLLGSELGVVRSPEDGVVLGVTTLPTVKPGDPVCHLAFPRRGLAKIRRALGNMKVGSLHARVRGDLATNVMVDERDDDWS